MSDVTQILDRVQQGDPKAAEELVPLAYEVLGLSEPTVKRYWARHRRPSVPSARSFPWVRWGCPPVL